jgi:hypothetical protein
MSLLSSSRGYSWPLRLGVLLLASLVCLSAALYNGFPLVSSDTGAYLDSALHLLVPNDRPITYGLFIRLTGLHFSYWLVVWAQSLLLAALLLRCLHRFVPRLGWAGQLVALGLLAWATGFSWYCSQLMPDIFSGIGLLALGLLLSKTKSRIEQVALLLVLLLCTIVHSSNLVSYTLTCLGFGVLAWQQRLFARQLASRAQWLVTTATVLAGWVLLPALHAAFGGGFVASRAAPVFLMGRLVEAGIVDRYLADHCNDANAPWLCNARDQLPNDAVTFLWDASSPYAKSGGLEANLSAYRRIVRDIATSPRYYPALLNMALQSTLRQLTHQAHGDGLWAYRENSSPYWKIPEVIPFEMKPYLSSLQNHNLLHFEEINLRAYGTQLLALAGLVLVLGAAGRGQLAARAWPALLLLSVWVMGLIANAFAAGALANVLDRLQGRVAWLLPLGVGLVLAAWLPPGLPARLRRLLPPGPGATA